MDWIVLIYLANVLPNLQTLFGLAGGFGLGGALFVWALTEGDVRAPNWAFAARAALIFVAVLIPSERAIWLMVGAHVGTEFAATESAQEMFGQIQTIVMDRLSALATEASE